MKKPVTITLEENLLSEIEEKRGFVPRSKFIECLILRIFSENKNEEVGMEYA